MADRSVPDRLTARGRFVDRLRRRADGNCWRRMEDCPMVESSKPISQADDRSTLASKPWNKT